MYSFQVETGNQWFVQVIYTIGQAGKVTHRRYQRSALLGHRTKRSAVTDWTESLQQRNGTNMHSLNLDSSFLASQSEGRTSSASARVIAPAVSSVVVFILLLLLLCLLVLVYRRRKHRESSEMASEAPVCTSRGTEDTNLSRTKTAGASVRQLSPVLVKRTVRAHRNRWSLRPKSGTEV